MPQIKVDNPTLLGSVIVFVLFIAITLFINAEITLFFVIAIVLFLLVRYALEEWFGIEIIKTEPTKEEQEQRRRW